MAQFGPYDGLWAVAGMKPAISRAKAAIARNPSNRDAVGRRDEKNNLFASQCGHVVTSGKPFDQPILVSAAVMRSGCVRPGELRGCVRLAQSVLVT